MIDSARNLEKVAYRLRRRPEARPALALLLPGHDSSALLRLCARLGLDPLPQIFASADGFLLRLLRPLHQPVAGVIRLAELAANVLLPVDAELIPGLLPDEAAALGRARGLIFLPHAARSRANASGAHCRVLEFAPEQPVPLAQLLAIENVNRREWRPLPETPALAERIQEITLDRPDDGPEAIIEAGGEGIGVEEARPDDASLPRKLLGKPALGLGKALAWLGRMLHLRALAALGNKLMAGGLALVPRLSEKLLGKQEASLRALLDEFRQGNIERALRRALPLNDDLGRGATVAGDAQLPWNDPRYSLQNILGRGAGGIWLTRADLIRELEREYRRQAEAATRRGDYRRAAFIYGKLLADYHSAAAVLAQGGLHHDAAILYLTRLHDPLHAALQFEAAGEMERALELYRSQHDHVGAAELLRRIGEEELAVAEYLQAADLIVQSGKGHVQAGDLLLNKAQCPELAQSYFEAGWKLRPYGAAVPCACRLLRLHADAGDTESLLSVITEGEAFFDALGNESLAGQFFNDVARLAEHPALTEIREDLRDRALLGLAHELAQAAAATSATSAASAPDRLVPLLFGAGTIWETPLVRDAQFAVRAAPRSRIALPTPVSRTIIPARIPVVRAVAHAADSGELFLGFQSGEVACCDPGRGDVRFLKVQPAPVRGLAVSDDGDTVVVHAGGENTPEQLASFVRTDGYGLIEVRPLPVASGRWLGPNVGHGREPVALLWEDVAESLQILRTPRLLPEITYLTVAKESGPGAFCLEVFYPKTALLLTGGEALGMLAFDGVEMSYFARFYDGKIRQRVLCPFPAASADTSLAHPPLSLVRIGVARFELVGIGAEGALTWLDLHFEGDRNVGVISKSAKGPYLAAVLVRPGIIAAVDPEGIAWLRVSDGGIREQTRQRALLPNAVACFANHRDQELVVIGSDGSLSRVRQAL